jgi:acyl-CoA thioester hydrolase
MTHTCQLEVRTYENDSYGHVNNAVYLNYLEYARGRLLADNGFDYGACVAAGYGIWIARIEIDYKAPARYGDLLRVETEAVGRKATYGVFRQSIFKLDAGAKSPILSAQALVKWAFVDAASGRPTRVPPEWDRPIFNPDPAL